MHSLFSPRSYNEFPSGVSRCGRRLENATGSLRSPLSGVRTQICASGRRWRRGKMRAPWHVTGARGPKMSRPAWTYDTCSCHDTAAAAAAAAIVAVDVAAVAAIGVASYKCVVCPVGSHQSQQRLRGRNTSRKSKDQKPLSSHGFNDLVAICELGHFCTPWAFSSDNSFIMKMFSIFVLGEKLQPYLNH